MGQFWAVLLRAGRPSGVLLMKNCQGQSKREPLGRSKREPLVGNKLVFRGRRGAEA
jgi:hypothetical protein